MFTLTDFETKSNVSTEILHKFGQQFEKKNLSIHYILWTEKDILCSNFMIGKIFLFAIFIYLDTPCFYF